MSFDGEIGFILVTLLVTLGVMTLILALGREHARRRKAEARLRERSSAIESMVHAVVTLDSAGDIIEANSAALHLFDCEARHLIGRNIGEAVLDQDHGATLLAYLQTLSQDSKEWGRAVWVRRGDGTEFPSRMTIGAYQAGGSRFFILTLLDHARSSVLRDLQAGESRLRHITDAVPVLIAYFDTERRFRFHNRAFEDIFGLKPDQVQGRTMLEVFGPEHYEVMRARVDEVLSGYPVQFERSQHDTRGTPRSYEERYFPRYGEEGNDGEVIGFYSLTTDVTETRRINRVKTEFVSMVSHELRTPLTSIRGSLGLVAGGVAGKLPDAAKNLVDIAKSNCERLIRLINDILDTDKIESGKMRFDLKVIELAPLIARSIADNEGFGAQHDVSIKLAAGGESIRVNVDSDGLSQVVTNLLSNAVKFSPPRGTVEVALSRNAGRARLEVRDHGPGIAEEFRARIFQKFSQADSSDTRQRGGTGLGLSISKSIVERLGGTIGFRTEEGVGTTFFFELPESQEAPTSVFAAGARTSKRPCILVCEDDPDIAQLICILLGRAGYDTDQAYTAARARELATANPYAAMTLDLKLPDEDGIALMRSLREDERTRQLPIVVVSAISGEGRIRLNRESFTVSDWLGKPVDGNRLLVAVRNAVAARAHDKPRILHVEDDPDIQHITAAIARDFATFEFASSLQEARARLQVYKYDLILLDLNLPDGEGAGWSLVADIEALEPPPPIVVFSAGEVGRVEREHVAAVLVKSNTSNEELLETIQRVLATRPRFPVAVAIEPRSSKGLDSILYG